MVDRERVFRVLVAVLVGIAYAAVILVAPHFPGFAEAGLTLSTFALAVATIALVQATRESARTAERFQRIRSLPNLLLNVGIPTDRGGGNWFVPVALSNTSDSAACDVEVAVIGADASGKNLAARIGPWNRIIKPVPQAFDIDFGAMPVTYLMLNVKLSGLLGGRRVQSYRWEPNHFELTDTVDGDQ